MSSAESCSGGVRLFLDAAEAHTKQQDWTQLGAAAEAALAADPQCVEAHFVRAAGAVAAYDLASGAETAFKAMELGLNHSECADLLAIAHGLAGNFDTAMYYAKLAVALPPSPKLVSLLPASIPTFAHVLETMAEKPLLQRAVQHMVAGRWPQAEHWLRQHLAFDPSSRDAHLGLGTSLLAQGVPRAAVDALRAARHHLPYDAGIASLLGSALGEIGQREDALACHRWAKSLAPEDAAVHAQPIMALLRDPNARPAEIAAEVRDWGGRFGIETVYATGGNSNLQPGAMAADAQLTIGYVVAGRSADAEGQAAARILGRYDRSRCQAVGFGFGPLTSGSNVAFQKCFDTWHDISGTDAATLQAMIIAEKIDILVDLAGFSAPQLLIAFGGRMAPCQVAWLQAPYGTGLASMDYLLTDEFVDPQPAGARQFAETPAYAGAALVAECPEFAGALPSAGVEPGETVFVADAVLAELNAPTVEAWAHILHRVPGSVLVLRDHDFAASENLTKLIGMFGNFGLANRVDVAKETDGPAIITQGDPAFFAQGDPGFFAQGDIALMPLVQPRAKSVLAALAAGVPAICAAGEGRHTREAASVLHHLGLSDRMTGDDLASYVDAACHWAFNPDERKRLRASLPDHLPQAPLFDPNARMRDLEAVYRTLWARTVEKDAAETKREMQSI